MVRPPDLVQPTVKIDVLPWGVTHVTFLKAPPTITVQVRDPVTRRLDRRELLEGMKSQVIYYDSNGRLIGD